jgi:hypothetical protein
MITKCAGLVFTIGRRRLSVSQTHSTSMKNTLKLIPFAGLIAASGTVQAATIFEDTFTGGTADLNGKVPASTTGGAAWIAANNFDLDGSFDGSGGTATLAFTPSSGFVYTLDASITGISGDGNWLALGFANGQNTTPGTTNRFVNGNVVEGRAWLLARGNNTPNPNAAHTVGSGNGVLWSGSIANANGGDIDLRVVLDTTGGTGSWETTWFARRPTDGTYTEVRPTSPVTNESYDSVGFAVSNSGVSGTLTSFSLNSVVPEPSSALLAGLGALALLRRRR